MTTGPSADEPDTGDESPFGANYLGYSAHHPDWHEQDAPWKAAHVASMLADHGLAPTSACDLGCGTGGVVDEVARRCPSITTAVGYEQSDEAVALAPAERRERVELVVGDFSDGRSFDVALVLDVMEHVDDVQGFLAAVRVKSAWFVLHIPLDRSVVATLRPGQYDRLRRLMGHVHSYTRTSAVATLANAGFDVVDSRYTFPAIDRPTTGLQRLARAPRRLGARVAPGVVARVLGGCSLLVLARSGTGDAA